MNQIHTTNIYYHPIIVPAFLCLPLFMLIPIYSLITTVSSLTAYIFIAFLILISIYGTIRILKLVKQLIKGTPALTLTAESLIDLQSGVKLNWEDIISFQIGGYRTTYISVKINNREKYIQKFKNDFTRFMYRFNSKVFHGSFTINVSMMKESNENILSTLERYLDNHKQNFKN